MIRHDLIEKAELAEFTAVAHELHAAASRYQAGLFTEAVMRLGRATEASLYAVAREFGINVNLHIPALSVLQDSILGMQARILKIRTTEEVKKLAVISKQLSEAIAVLMEDADSRSGVSCDRPRGNNAILSEVVAAVGDPGSKRRLGMNGPLLEKIMRQRNAAAHAALTGELREIEAVDFSQLAEDFQEFIDCILDIAIGRMSHTARRAP